MSAASGVCASLLNSLDRGLDEFGIAIEVELVYEATLQTPLHDGRDIDRTARTGITGMCLPATGYGPCDVGPCDVSEA
jgi:hypothetical protein